MLRFHARQDLRMSLTKDYNFKSCRISPLEKDRRTGMELAKDHMRDFSRFPASKKHLDSKQFYH